MTDRHSGYVVALDANMREDNAQAVLDAIRMIKGVISVRPLVADPMAEIHAARTRRELTMKILDLIQSE